MLSFRRLYALLRKEWIQITRDAITLRFIVALPIVQLFLFGFAINTNPQHLPTGLLLAENSKYERTIVAALRNSGYYDIRMLASEAEAERALAQGDLMFVVAFPPNFDRSVDRGDTAASADRRRCHRPERHRLRDRGAGHHRQCARSRPAAGDAREPGDAGIPIRHPRPLQSRAAHGAQHRAGADLHRADDVRPCS